MPYSMSRVELHSSGLSSTAAASCSSLAAMMKAAIPDRMTAAKAMRIRSCHALPCGSSGTSGCRQGQRQLLAGLVHVIQAPVLPWFYLQAMQVSAFSVQPWRTIRRPGMSRYIHVNTDA